MTNRPKRILALDGGGLRGVASIAFLERLEERLRLDHGRPIALHEHFDLIGGTSTGSIIATGLALGQPLSEIKDHYFRLAPNVFRRAWNRIPLVHAIFSAEALQREFLGIVGDRTLAAPDLKTGLAIITKRVDTGAVWFLTNNSAAPYWNDPEDGSYIGNRHYSLANIIRASTAAPHFFDPHLIEIVKGKTAGLFVDGGVSPHNNPALALLHIATVPAYGYGWETGQDQLEITSIGTGSFRYRVERKSFSSRFAAPFAIDALRSMMSDNDTLVLMMMQTLGRCQTPWSINSEIGNLCGVCIAPEPLFTFRRYDLLLEHQWLKDELGIDMTARQLARIRDITSLSTMESIYSMASAVAEKQIAGSL
jgi:hypothetical protein